MNMDAEENEKSVRNFILNESMTVSEVKAWCSENSDRIDDYYGASNALDVAITKKRMDIVHALIESGASLTVSDKSGLTSLHHAILCNEEEVVRLLIASGADVHQTDRDGWDALFFAINIGNKPLVSLLLAEGLYLESEKASKFLQEPKSLQEILKFAERQVNGEELLSFLKEVITSYEERDVLLKTTVKGVNAKRQQEIGHAGDHVELPAARALKRL